MSLATDNAKRDPAIGALLDRLRRRIRAYAVAQGFCALIVWLGVAFWASLALDWFFEPPPTFRLCLLLVGMAGVGSVLYDVIVRRALARLGDEQMAMLLERRFPQLDDTLLTSVVLARRDPAAEGFDPTMLAVARAQASERVGSVPLAAVFNMVPLRMTVLTATAMVLTVAVFGMLAPAAIEVWTRRIVTLADEPWPRRTRLEAIGFADGVMTIARGADAELLVRADTTMPVTPQTVEVHYRGGGRWWRRTAMTREGDAVAGRDAFQEYSHVFRNVLAPVELTVAGGDARLSGLRIEVVDPPAIEQMALRCKFPAYMDRSPRTVPVVGVMQIPQGTHVTLEGRATKPLARVDIMSTLDNGPWEPIGPTKSAETSFRCALPPLEKDATLLVTPYDLDDIGPREPIRLVLAVTSDQAPALAVRFRGIGTAITPQAVLPVVGRITDDYGIARAWFAIEVEDAASGEHEFFTTRGNPTEMPIDHALDVRELNLAPGKQLTVGLKAADRCDLGDGPNIGVSQPWTLEVVSPEQLRIMLQARELILRQRFEMILKEVTDTRDLLVRMDFGAVDAPDTDAVRPEGAEPGDAPTADMRGDAVERVLVGRSLHCERAVQNCRKNSDETLGIAEGFDTIRLELVNNRIDTEELKMRLASGIAEPLRHVAGVMFPELESRLVRLRAALADDQLGDERRSDARLQVDAILVAMNEVLGLMLELEDFNEAVALLEEIIQTQRALADEARRRQKDMLHDLLLEDAP